MMFSGDLAEVCMLHTLQEKACSTTQLLNPIISAVIRTFESMFECTPHRTGLELKRQNAPVYPLSAIVSLTGQMNGTIVLSVSESVGIEILKRLVFEEVSEINSDVCDAVGEVANMIAGSAKGELAHLKLTLGIPNMVLGKDHEVYYRPEVARPMCLHFDSEMGPFSIEFGFQ